MEDLSSKIPDAVGAPLPDDKIIVRTPAGTADRNLDALQKVHLYVALCEVIGEIPVLKYYGNLADVVMDLHPPQWPEKDPSFSEAAIRLLCLVLKKPPTSSTMIVSCGAISSVSPIYI